MFLKEKRPFNKGTPGYFLVEMLIVLSFFALVIAVAFFIAVLHEVGVFDW